MSAGEIIALVAGAIGVLSFMYTVFRGKRGDVSQDAEMKSDVKYIRNRMDEMLIDQKAMSQRMGDLDTRIVRCEESCKQAHRRIDGIENRPPGPAYVRQATQQPTKGE